LWYNTTPVNGLPGVISTANGWVQEAAGTITGIANTTTTTTQPFFTGLNFVIPANTTYGIAVYAAGQRYFSMTTAQTFSDLGCDLITGPNISYGGGAPNGAAPTFTPRGWIGTINFVFLTPCSGVPTAGTALAPATVCANQSFNLSLSGQSQGSGLTYQWMTGPTATGPWTYITGATTLSYATSQTIDTYYSCEVTCTNSSLADTSASVFVQTNPNLAAGTYTIGASGNYPNFNAAVAAMSCGIAGPVIFNVLPGSGPYNEQVEIPQIINASSTNTITFNGNGETITYTTTASPGNYIIRLNGADYVTINDLKVLSIGTLNIFAVHLTNNADFNTINNCTIDLLTTISSTSTTNVGIAVSGSLTSATGLGASGSYNTFSNNLIQGGYYAITLVGTSATVRAIGNVVSNNDIQDFYFYGIYHSQTNNTQVLNNLISRPVRSTLSSFYGIYYTGGGENNLAEANTLFNAFGGNVSSTSAAYPIYHTGIDATVGNENKVINNLIYDINHNGTIYGMYNSSSDGVFYYHNTISLDNTAATAGLTRGFYQLTTASGIDFRNNIITINRSGTGVKHAIYLGTPTSTVTSNNNTLFVGNPTGTNGYGFYGVNFQTFANWQTANSNAYDQNSVDVDPLYVNASSGNFTPTNPSAGDFGAVLGVLTDINGAARSATTPDPGAIEFVPPSCAQPSALNVPTFTGFTADLAWTENGTATTWDIEWGTAGFTPTGTPTIIGTTTNPHQITGLTPLTNYDFYVRANCGGSTSLWSGPFTFITGCATQLAGTYTIGTAGNYLTFTDAVNDLISCGISAPVIFNVITGSGPFNEQITIPQILGASATNTIIFNGNGETINFTTTTSPGNHIIRLDGADHITFDSLNIVTISALNNFAVHLINNADSNTINNCVIDLTSAIGNTGSTNVGIAISGSLTSATTTGASGTGNTITNNTVIGGYYNITNVGASAASNSTYNLIENNNIQDFYLYGIYLSNTSNSTIKANRISRPTRTAVSTFYGIYHTSSGENNTIESNRIFDAYRGVTGANTSTSYGIYHTGVDATAGNENKVINNLIYAIENNGGIYAFYNSSSDGVHYYHNTISLDDPNATGGLARGFYQITLATGIEFKNNIISITRGGTGNKHCIYLGTTTTSVVSNNNVFYLNAPAGTNGIGWYSTNQATLSDWQLVNGAIYDANSVGADPLFINVAANNFMPSSPLVDGIADATVGVATDIFGTTRAVTPDPGAIEFVPPTCPQPSSLTAINVASNSADLSWIETGGATTWQLEWDTVGIAFGSGNFLITTTNPHSLTGLSPQSDYRYYVRSICAVGDTSLWAGPYTLTTLCAPFTAPWLDNVEAHATTTNSTIENCWSSSPTNTTSAYRWDIDGAGGTPSSSTGPSGAFSGNNYFYTEASNGSAGDVAELYSPLIDVNALTLPELSFYYHMYGQTMGDLYIDVFDGVNWVTTDSIKGEQQTADTDPWLKHRIILNNFPDTIQVRFRSIKTGTSFYGDMALDDVEIAEAPTCPQPIALNVSNLTMNSAALGWTEVGSATNWQVQWGISGFALGNGVQILTTNNPFTQFGLQAAVTYDFYVRSVCAIGDSSLWTGPYTFTTPICNPSQQCNYTFRMTDSFGDGWNGNTMAIIQNGITVATIGGTFTTGNGPIDITVPLCSTFPFSLYWNTGGSFATEVGVQIIDANNTSIFTHNPGIDLSGTTLFTDSVFCPSCPSASNLTDNAVSSTSVDLGWTVNSTATSWQVEWDTTGFIQGTGNIAITANNPYNISGLTPGGVYQFYVRDICAIGDTSNWSGPHTFTTPLCDIAYQCSYIFRMTDSFGDGWNGNTMDIIQGGIVVATIGATFTTGNGPIDIVVPLCDTIPVDLFWNTGGSWNTEVGVQIIDASNTIIFTHNAGLDLSGTTIFSGIVNCPCADPSNLTASNVTQTSADLAWIENSTATMWNVEWSTAGFTLGTGTLIPSTTNNPENVTGLSPATAYEFYVQADCGQDSSIWVGPHQFITSCVLNNLGADTTICSINDLTLDAGSGFSTYSWSNGSSSQTILVDSTNFGLGIHTIYVDVTDTISGCTATDTIVVEITTCVGVKENTATIAMNVYPNPSKGQFTVNLTTTNTTDLQIRITNVQGQEVFVKNNFDNINLVNENINIGNVKGVYFVNIITNNEVITKKIIVQ